MKIYNESTKYNTNFGELRSYRAQKELYKYQNQLSCIKNAIEQNPKLMEFCNKYTTDVFVSVERLIGEPNIKASLNISYIDPSKNKFRRFLGRMFGNQDFIYIREWSDDGAKNHVKNALEKVKNSVSSGEKINSEIEMAEQRMQIKK